MKIIEFRAERFKRLSAVEIVPEGNTVIISGKNGQGKSSVLDAIWLALGGGNATKDSATTVPIKDGEKDAVVRLDLGDIIVTRKWTANGSTLTVEGADGRKYSSPQTLLDTLVGTISFDPLSFAKMPPMEQRSRLIDLVNLPVNLDELSVQRKAFYDQRTFVNRELKTIQAELAGIQLPDNDVPEEEISIAEMTKKIGLAQDQHSRIIMGRQRLQEKVEKGNALRELIQQKTEELTALANQIRSETEMLDSCKEPDVQAMRSQIENAEQINQIVRQKKRKAGLQVQMNEKTMESDGITQQIEAIDLAKKEAFLNVRFPVDGLAVDEEGITYNGIPFRQCSSAEQLKVCVAIASALNPEIRVIRVPDASLLDGESMKVMQDLAQQQDIQIWMERVTDGKEKVGVVIEDGTVKSL